MCGATSEKKPKGRCEWLNVLKTWELWCDSSRYRVFVLFLWVYSMIPVRIKLQ